MKYTMMGFSQERMMELGMDVVHAAILRWLIDFAGTGKMETRDVGGLPHYLVRPIYVSKQMPCLRLNSRQAVQKRLNELDCMDVLSRHVDEKGKKTFYGFGDHYESLLFKTTTPVAKSPKTTTPVVRNDNPSCQERQPQLPDSSIIDESIKNTLPAKAGKKKDYRTELKKKFEKAMAEANLAGILVYGLELKNGAPFSNYPKEWTCAKQVVRKINTVRNGVPECDFLINIVRAYDEKKRTSAAEFWRDAPYMPSALNVRFDQAFEYMRHKTEEHEEGEEFRDYVKGMKL